MACRNAPPHRELAESVRLLLNAGADINAKRGGSDGDGWTALMYGAARSCCTAVPDILLRAGAHPCVRSSQTCITALHIAAEVGLTETCELLLTKADTLLEMKDNDGQTALKTAAIRGRADNVKLLIQHGADVIAADSEGTTPLFTAVQQQHERVALQLLEAGADVHI
jgi:uncharacterized protein